MRQRHNYVAHSGDDKVENSAIALVFPQQRNAMDKVELFTELFQPDFMDGFNDTEIMELVHHIHSFVKSKITELTQKIMEEEIAIRSYEEWRKIGKDSIK